MRVPQLPERLEWSHNTYYHRWLLRQLPSRLDRALDAGLDRLAELVRLGGVLVVGGHSRPTTVTDRFLSAMALPADAAVGLTLAVAGRAREPDDDGMPIADPDATFAEIRGATERLPGSEVTRGVQWQFLLTWRRPLLG